MIKYFRIFFKLVEITIDISVFCHIFSIFFFIFFFFSFDVPGGSIIVLVVLPLGSKKNNNGLWCNGSTRHFDCRGLGPNPDSLVYADVMEWNIYTSLRSWVLRVRVLSSAYADIVQLGRTTDL